jgi:hypothetical protein
MKLISKKKRESKYNYFNILVIKEIFELIKSIPESELIPLRDSY